MGASGILYTEVIGIPVKDMLLPYLVNRSFLKSSNPKKLFHRFFGFATNFSSVSESECDGVHL